MASGKPSVDPKMATGESRAKKSAPEIVFQTFHLNGLPDRGREGWASVKVSSPHFAVSDSPVLFEEGAEEPAGREVRELQHVVHAAAEVQRATLGGQAASDVISLLRKG
ncbi:unnamed protein product [Cladocopium goreaui]|uniref:Uncharacterized protein n=1 Tax=Cladocopium goreaui TaxID=2562237 RepID=A0A9P1DWP6_9DINO|nr:unnamed protein product [Cladocopium goreaui]|mmetsp:Transcript_63109/g.138220  ORF Transcript_63109/g.138220 Transcript_63109/m.138220 type:complete len:109 (+) Transcript_63109:52-378(+)